jgi:hypothetical protein
MGAAARPAFPWVPIGSLAFISFASCFSVTYIFPIVPYLVVDLGMVDDYREPGLYAVRAQPRPAACWLPIDAALSPPRAHGCGTHMHRAT